MAPKRKSDAAGGGSSKKARGLGLSEADITKAKSFLDAALAAGADNDTTLLAKYARQLEEELAQFKPKVKTPEEIADDAETIRSLIVRGMTKMMKWTPSCKTQSARLSYEGLCRDPAVFGAALGLPGPPKWKMHKYTVDEFQNAIGSVVEGSVRYDTLHLYENVTVHYKSDEGTFKVTATYGKLR